jgi:6-pyruvoyl-tetrahydropterin synthase
VHTSLGGGNHGYLGLVLGQAQYVMVSLEPFEAPNHPGAFVLPVNITQQQIATLQSRHTETTHLFREFMGVQKALIQQIVKALDHQYLTALCNHQTKNAIEVGVHQILQFLFNTYGKVSPQLLHAEEENVKAHTYDPTNPIGTVFNQVEDLVDYSEAAGILYTCNQSIGITYVILNKSGRYCQDIRDWNHLPENEKTWLGFKAHFC